MGSKNEVEVVIGGEVYRLSADESEEYIQRVATYINKKISDIYENSSNPTINSSLRTLFVSINIADDFLKEQDKSLKQKEDLDTYFQEVTRLESENHLLKQKIKLLQKEIEEVKLEFQEYINTFDNKEE